MASLSKQHGLRFFEKIILWIFSIARGEPKEASYETTGNEVEE
jgi:hypothetical protein